MKARRRPSACVVVAVLIAPSVGSAQPMGTACTYQGQLKHSSRPVNDACDFQFRLFDALTGGVQIGPTLSVVDLEVRDGLFTVPLDFGVSSFTGNPRYLEIAVQGSADPGFTTLSPRQEITPVPYGIFAGEADKVDGYDLVDLDDRYVDEDQANSVSTAMIRNGAITTTRIAGSAVITEKIADSAVTTEKIVDEAVTTDKIAADAVTVAKLAHDIDAASLGFNADLLDGYHVSGLNDLYVEEGESDAVASGMIQDAAITSQKMAGQAVTTAKIADDAVTAAKLAHNINATGIGFNADKLDGQHASSFASNGHNHYRLSAADGAPSNALYVDDDGDVGINNVAPDARLGIKGTQASDARIRLEAWWNPEILFDLGSSQADGKLRFQVAGSDRWTFQFKGAHDALQFLKSGTGTLMEINGNGRVGIGTESPTAKLHVAGNICYTGTIGACSDGRFKRNIETVKGALGKVAHLRGVAFDWRRDEYPEHKFSEERQIGFIAQELEEVVPEAVTQGSDGTYRVDYGRLAPLLVEAVKELNETGKRKDAQIDALSDRIARLEAKLSMPHAEREGGVR